MTRPQTAPPRPTHRLAPRVAAALTAAVAATAPLVMASPVAAGAAPVPAHSAAAPVAVAPLTASSAVNTCNPKLAGTTTRTAPGAGKTVALTFDDSSATDMTSVLRILRQQNVKATFFNIGSEDAKMPHVVAAAGADGHLVEPHTWTHEYPSKANGNWSIAWLNNEVARTAAQQQALTGRRPCFFRPPGGNMANVPAVARMNNMQTVLWSVDSRDWSEQRVLTAAATAGIVKRATDLRYAANKNHPIVLLHDGKMSPEPNGHTFSDRPNTVAALPKIIAWYRSHGYRFVAMDGTSGLNPAKPAPVTPAPLNPNPSGVGFTSDARPDILAISADGNLKLYSGNGAGYVTGPTRIGTGGWAGYTGLYATDWTGDKRRDVLARSSAGELRLYRGTGAGGFTGPSTRLGTGWNMYDVILAPGDVTGDGKADLLGRTPSGQLSLYRGNGAGGFGGGGTKVSIGWQRYDLLFTSGDFTGDGKADLVGRTRDGKLWMIRGTGTGQFAAPTQIGAGWNVYAKLFSAGDLNGDGKADVSALTPSGSMVFYAGTGTGAVNAAASSRHGGWTFPVVAGVN